MKNHALAARNFRHGHHGTRTYKSWDKMMRRCLNTRNIGYKNYGGRGVTVCERWKTFSNFMKDMGPRPSIHYSIDRFPDANGNYEPGNCRWATSKQQANNRRSNRLITINGVTKTLAKWASRSPVSYAAIHMRLRSGWPIEKALHSPKRFQFNSYGALKPGGKSIRVAHDAMADVRACARIYYSLPT